MAAMDSACFFSSYTQPARPVGLCRLLSRAFTALLLGFLLVSRGIAADASASPHDVVEGTAEKLRDQLNGRQDYYAEHLDELYVVIDEVLSPVFDMRYSGRLVLGKHWSPATADQRDRFIAAFYAFLIKTYAKGMLEFDQDNMRVLPQADASAEKKARVKTELRLNDGSTVPINYSLRKSSSGWKVYDVRIEGVSYVQNYRNQFSAEISATGIDAVIARLEQEAAAINIDT
ncbi:MAG: MlaC/ttg2D family ABC transporter substrate-binding protein [Gammaproteobacteria bacterium]